MIKKYFIIKLFKFFIWENSPKLKWKNSKKCNERPMKLLGESYGSRTPAVWPLLLRALHEFGHALFLPSLHIFDAVHRPSPHKGERERERATCMCFGPKWDLPLRATKDLFPPLQTTFWSPKTTKLPLPHPATQ